MLTVLSPAKSLNFEDPIPEQFIPWLTQPRFIERSAELNHLLRGLNRAALRQLMSISEALADLNYQRNADWSAVFGQHNAKPAILAFDGDVYDGFAAQKFGLEALLYAQKHVRILSGLYGVLRPLDWMQPYRLEMGTALPNRSGLNLYAFWGSDLAQSVQLELAEHTHPVLINLASQEYFKALSKIALAVPVIEPVFKDCKMGVYKVIGFFAKRARGAMARYVVHHQIDQPQGLEEFTEEGYYLVDKISVKAGVEQWVYHREERRND